MKPLDERSYAFVVKIWEERRDVAGAGPMWRGSVEDVQSGVRTYFSTLHDLTRFLAQSSGMMDARSRPGFLARLRRAREERGR